MSVIDVVVKAISSIAQIAQFYFPGYVFYSTFHYCCRHRYVFTVNSAINCVIMSIVATFTVEALFSSASLLTNLAISIMALFVLGILCSILFKNVHFINAFSRLFHRTPTADFWESVNDPSGTMLTVKSQTGEKVVGFIHRLEEEGDNRWVQISSYARISKDGEVLEKSDGNDEIILKLKSDDVIVVTYEKGSPYNH